MNIKQLLKFIFVAVLALSFSPLVSAQLLTQTTLAAAVTGGCNFDAGTVGPFQSFVTLTSITGLQPALLGTQIQSYIWVDKELMGVVGPIPSSATLPVPVIRGMRGTPACAHVSGRMVLFGQVNLMGQNAFFDRDPIPGACSTIFPQSPWINILTGYQWLCGQLPASGGTGSWVAGFNNPGTSQIPANQSCGTFASAAGTNAVPCPFFAVSGTNAIVTWTPPVGFDTTQGGCFVTIPTGIWTWTAAGNISVLGTVTAANLQVVTWCWNPITSKWMPSRVS
jgi:hypothetical protein